MIVGKDYKKIAIPKSLFQRIEEKIAGSETKSVEEFVVSVLEEKLAKEDDVKETFTKEDEDKVKERLKALGYMD